MATTTKYVEKGQVVTVPAPAGGVINKNPILIGNVFGIPQATALEGVDFPFFICEAWEIQKAAGAAYTGLTTIAYWDVADKEINTDTANPAVGVVLFDAASDDVVCTVLFYNPKWITAAAASSRLDVVEAGQFAGQSLTKLMIGAGTQKGMTVSDTYVSFTEDALQFAANAVEANDEIEYDFTVFLDGMNAAYLTTFSLLMGALEVDNIAITTGDTNDYARLRGKVRVTAVGASSTVHLLAGDGYKSDGGVIAEDARLLTKGSTGPATTSAVVFTPRIKAATGNASNLATLVAGKIKLSKAA